MDRENSNERVFQLANDIAKSTEDFPKIRPLTEILVDKKSRLLGHVIRRPRQHPMHQVSFSTVNADFREIQNRRKGRPRQHWIKEAFKNAWDQVYRAELGGQSVQTATPKYDHDNPEHRNKLIDKAFNNTYPFVKTQTDSAKSRYQGYK